MPASQRIQADGTNNDLLLENGVDHLVTEPYFTAADFASRLASLLPQSWFRSNALAEQGSPNLNDGAWGLVSGIGVGILSGWNQFLYSRQQTRIATATDANLDTASMDYLGSLLPRVLSESDQSFAPRISATVVQQSNSVAAIATAVLAYLRAYSTPPISVNVYDKQSNNARATAFGVKPPQFVIETVYPVARANVKFLGRAYLGRSMSYLFNDANTAFPSATALDPNVATIVGAKKAQGTVPLYVQLRQII